MRESWDEFWQRASWEEYYARGWGLDPDLSRERSMFNPYDANLPDEPLFFTRECHPLDFSCQCSICVRKHTISMQDRDFLTSIGVVWAPKNITR